MPRITPISWQKFEKFLLYVGCEFVREKGDHRLYDREGLLRPIVIPRLKELPVFIIQNNLRNLKVSHDQYLEIMERL